MANPYRGEVALTFDGVPRTLRLTLGALVELEAELGSESLLALVERFESGQFRAADILALLAAGLRGGGAPMEREALLSAEIEGGPVAAAQAAAQLLRAAFTVGAAEMA
ncbi:MAG: gene transfer agent family protein [Pseudomonadota bacterium]